jgi:hypothetical protein
MSTGGQRRRIDRCIQSKSNKFHGDNETSALIQGYCEITTKYTLVSGFAVNPARLPARKFDCIAPVDICHRLSTEALMLRQISYRLITCSYGIREGPNFMQSSSRDAANTKIANVSVNTLSSHLVYCKFFGKKVWSHPVGR